MRKMSSLVGPFYCILCQKAKEDLDHILWYCDFASRVWGSFFQTFGMLFARHRDNSDMIAPQSAFWGEKPLFVVCRGVLFYGCYRESETRVFEEWIGILWMFGPLFVIMFFCGLRFQRFFL